jgi:hypothetical protein
VTANCHRRELARLRELSRCRHGGQIRHYRPREVTVNLEAIEADERVPFASCTHPPWG